LVYSFPFLSPFSYYLSTVINIPHLSYYKIAIAFLISILLCTTISTAQKKGRYNDGPYIQEKGDEIELRWIKNGKLKKEEGPVSDTSVFKVKGLPTVDLTDLSFEKDIPTQYDSISRFLAISDIHGQHDLFTKILKAHNVIDSSLQWSYGSGHLMIVGDIFDRGDKVTETLWFLFQLEKEALAAGGRVHVLLGNHELMVLHDDIRYIHPKYNYTSGKMRRPYSDLFSKETVLGKWLRTKNICEKINDVVFVHGGFSKAVLDRENSLDAINSIFKETITDHEALPKGSNGFTELLYFENGPLWYRGYADPNGFDVGAADEILELLDAETIVVGHTSMPKIVTLHDNRIILIDSSIKFGTGGEALIYDDRKMYRGLVDGNKILLGEENDKGLGSPFEYVYNLGDDDLTIILNTDVKKLIKNKLGEEYQKCKLTAIHNKEFNRVWDIKIRSRGNMRKKICHLPPLKLNFPKSTLRYLGFDGHDKLKLVIPCDRGKTFQQGIYREQMVYRLYQLVDTLAFRTRHVNIVLQNKRKTNYDFDGFFVEDEHDFSDRTGAQIIEEGIVSADATDRISYLKLMFFQYMICNTDWSYYNKHNLRIIHIEGEERVKAVPHDFDYAGIVGMEYAVPHDRMPINNVWQPFFRGKNVTHEDIEMVEAFYESIKEDIYNTISNDTYLNDRSKKKMLRFIDLFYSTLTDENQWEDKFINPKKLISAQK